MHDRFAPSSSAVAALYVDECDRDRALISIPRPELHLVARFGPSVPGGVDIHAFGFRRQAHRKTIRAGQWSITARLPLAAHPAVLGAPASAIAGRIVALEDLWGAAAAQRLRAQLATAPTRNDAVAIVDRALASRVADGSASRRTALAVTAAHRLETSTVTEVAAELGLSERHLRRLFHEAVGVSPKAYAKLARFHRALGAASRDRRASWASIAAAAGYYDQAHLIDDFRAIAGVTPRALVEELASSAFPPLGLRPVRTNPVTFSQAAPS